MEDLFDVNTLDTTPFAVRQLQLEKRDTVETYIAHLEKIYNDNKFIQRLDKVVDKIHKTEDPIKREELLQKLDKLDRERAEYMRAAEKKLEW